MAGSRTHLVVPLCHDSEYRDDDKIISIYAKSGTTRILQIIRIGESHYVRGC